MTMRQLLLLILFAFSGSSIPADDPAEDTDIRRERWEFFENKVRPLLQEHCLECHSTEAAAENGELDLQRAAGIARGGSRGLLNDASSPESGLLARVISYQDSDPDLRMPPSGQLSPGQREVLMQWAMMGLPVPEYQPEEVRRTEEIDFAAGREFWAFQPLQQIVLPDEFPRVGRESEVIDFMIQHRLQQAGIDRGQPASRPVLMRRLSFDLTGLPPSPEDLSRVLTEDDQWVAREIERLLGEVSYGERWARFWLDLARYTDLTPDWQSPTDRGWLYRDWVVAAFNRNLPYDEFVRLQLAADKVHGASPADQAALGFLGLSPTYWKELRLAPEVIQQIVADEWDERTDTVSRTFLGLTVSCARCHDHKFDPVSTEDYYGLTGVVASTQLDERPLLAAETAARVIAGRSELAELQEQLNAKPEPAAQLRESLERKISELRNSIPELETPFAHVVRDATIHVLPDGAEKTRLEYHEGEAIDLEVFRRGNPSNRGKKVGRRFLTVLSTEGEVALRQGSGRLQLADAILNEGRSLTARVIVNRVWAEHFGRGLVGTLSDFGRQGDRPSHPELLEYLSGRFIEEGWDIKWLHRQILLSQTWQLSSEWNDKAGAKDPENRLLWRANRRQLPFEMWRDAMLSASGRLEATVGGPGSSIDQQEFFRRSLYLIVAREELHPVQRMHDFPEATAHSPARVPTTTPLQQLYMLNSDWIRQRAVDLHQRLGAGDERQRIQRLWQLSWGRHATDAELEDAVQFIRSGGGTSDEIPAWQDLIQAVLSANEFHFLE